jgi:hypothetical protein
LIASWGEPPPAGIVNPLLRAEIASAKPATLRQLAEAYARLAARVAPEKAGGPTPAADEPAELAELRKLLGVEGTPLVVPLADAMRVSTREEQTEHRRRKKEINKHNTESPGGPHRGMVLLDNQKPVDSHVFVRGNPGRPGEKVNRRLPKLLGGAEAARDASGRLDLARAIVAPGNPLTARVLVNWAWTHHFGRGLVDTPGDLGLRGEPPSHPELLDDLARRFIEEGKWSLRWLHREIVTSRAWRQSSAAAPSAGERDPDNRFFCRAERRRLDWEAWRDSLLVAAGTLPPASPAATPAGGAVHRGGKSVDPLVEATMNARTIYGRLDRQDVPGILRVFDIANPDTAVHVRSRTTVPQQSLAVLNAPLVVAAARKLAARATGADDAARVTALWRAALARSPSPEEQAAALAFLAEEARLEPDAPAAPAADPLAATPASENPPAAAPPAAAAKDKPPATPPAPFTRWDRLAQAVLATAEFQFFD